VRRSSLNWHPSGVCLQRFNEMATRTALSPDSLRYRLRDVSVLRHSLRLARRLRELPRVIPTYTKRLGFEGLRVFVATAMARREVRVVFPGVSEPIRIRQGTSDKFCFEQIFLSDDYKLDFPHDPSLIVDGGANVGYASIYFANHYPRASILAVEPEPSNFSALVANLQAYPQVKALRAAIWRSPEPLVVDSSDECWAAYVTEPNSVKEDSGLPSVQGSTIANLLQMSGKETIDILKLDVEGAEKEIFLSSDCSWLSKTKILIVELHDRLVPGCTEALEGALQKYSFRQMAKGENRIFINNQLPC
jgi:FkbM family methyltransferase